MNWLLDADVASQVSRPRPNPNVLAWLEVEADRVFLSALTMAEIAYGVTIAPESKRARLQAFVDGLLRVATLNATHFAPTGVRCAEF